MYYPVLIKMELTTKEVLFSDLPHNEKWKHIVEGSKGKNKHTLDPNALSLGAQRSYISKLREWPLPQPGNMEQTDYIKNELFQSIYESNAIWETPIVNVFIKSMNDPLQRKACSMLMDKYDDKSIYQCFIIMMENKNNPLCFSILDGSRVYLPNWYTCDNFKREITMSLNAYNVVNSIHYDIFYECPNDDEKMINYEDDNEEFKLAVLVNVKSQPCTISYKESDLEEVDVINGTGVCEMPELDFPTSSVSMLLGTGNSKMDDTLRLIYNNYNDSDMYTIKKMMLCKGHHLAFTRQLGFENKWKFENPYYSSFININLNTSDFLPFHFKAPKNKIEPERYANYMTSYYDLLHPMIWKECLKSDDFYNLLKMNIVNNSHGSLSKSYTGDKPFKLVMLKKTRFIHYKSFTEENECIETYTKEEVMAKILNWHCIMIIDDE